MKKDLQQYLMSMQAQFDEMKKAFEFAEEESMKGNLSEEVCKQVADYYNVVASNYDRVQYCVHVMNLPPKWIQKLQQNKLNKKLKQFIDKKADRESIEAENKEAIDKMKETLNET